MTNEYLRTIEIEGIKVEVDLRTAKKVEAYRVGDKVKVLTKTYSGYATAPGVIVGIEAFKNLPTIVIAYVPDPLSYGGDAGKVSFAHLNAQTKDVEICPMCEDDVVPTRQTMVSYFDRAIQVAHAELQDIVTRKEFFLRQFGTAFGVGAEEIAATVGD